MSSNSVSFGSQDAAAGEPNSRNREPQVRAIPIRTVVAAVPASYGRGSDSSRGSIGILYPVLAKVQHVSSGNSNGTTAASQASDQHHDPNGNNEQPIPDSAAQQQNAAVPGGNGNSSLPSEALNGQGFSAQIRGGLEQLLSTIFPGEYVLSNSADPRASGSVLSRTESVQGIGNSQEPVSAASDEGIILCNILRQIIPIVSENTGAESNMPSTEGANSDETWADGNPARGVTFVPYLAEGVSFSGFQHIHAGCFEKLFGVREISLRMTQSLFVEEMFCE